MKYGIIIIALAFTAEAFGQQAKMDAKAFQKMVFSFTAQQAAIPAEHSTISTAIPGNAIEVNNNQTGTEIATIATSGLENSCDVVVQEELVAGRMASTENDISRAAFNFDKIKGWLAALFHKKELQEN